MTDIIKTHPELVELVEYIARKTATIVLVETGQLKRTISAAEAVRISSRALFEDSKKYVDWKKKGPGKYSSVIADRVEFYKYLDKHNEQLKPVKK